MATGLGAIITGENIYIFLDKMGDWKMHLLAVKAPFFHFQRNLYSWPLNTDEVREKPESQNLILLEVNIFSVMK